jgi:hypothetical protein
MKAIGFFIAFVGWLFSMNGYTFEHVAMIVTGLSLVALGYYLERR